MITVLLAAYNGQAYIGEQLDSILAQSQGGIHIVVSDDCSGDRTREIVAEYVKRCPEQITLVCRSKPSGGPARHFLWLLSAAAAGVDRLEGQDLKGAFQAEYFMLSDQDDWWLPEKAEKLLGKMKELEGAFGEKCPLLVHSDLAVANDRMEVTAESFFKYQKVSPERTRLSQLLVQNNVTGGAVMLNRPLVSLLRKRPRVCLMHDAWLALVAAAFGQIGWVEEPLYYYRQHRENTLGAEKGDSLEGAADRLKDGNRARENYRKLFGQARCLLELYGDRLSPEEQRTLRAFLTLPQAGLIRRGIIVLRYGFTKNTWLRTLGQIVMMNR